MPEPSRTMLEYATEDWEEQTEGRWTVAHPPERVSGFHFDTRKLKHGNVFFAWRGETRDGHAFLSAAEASGATAAVVERPDDGVAIPQLQVANSLDALHRIAAAHRARFAGKITAITGSYGKTSTKEMLARMLDPSTTLATAGNWNNHIGVPLTLLGIDPARHAHAVIEAGISLPGEMAPLGKLIAADAVVVTGIGTAHLEALGSRSTIAREKWQLAARAKPEAQLFFPARCLEFAPFAEAAREMRTTVVLEAGQAMITAARVRRYSLKRVGKQAMQVTLHGEDEGHPELVFPVATASRGMAANAALAAAAAQALGTPESQIVAGISDWQPGRIRGGWVEVGEVTYFVDCYNANPDALADALEAFDAETTGGGRTFVLGTMLELGEEAVTLHGNAMGGHRPREGDRYILIGERALTDAYAEALRFVGVVDEQLICLPETTKKPPVAFGPGPVFLKGSRRHALERWVPETQEGGAT